MTKSSREIAKRLAKGYMSLGDNPRQAIRCAFGFIAWADQVLGERASRIHLVWRG
jgi:hypothetical protein